MEKQGNIKQNIKENVVENIKKEINSTIGKNFEDDEYEIIVNVNEMFQNARKLGMFLRKLNPDSKK